MMENRLAFALGLAAIMGAAWLAVRALNATADAQTTDTATPDPLGLTPPDTTTDPAAPGLLEQISMSVSSTLGLWHPPAKYAALIANAETANGLPADMLARLLYQESRYREDIITGATKSPVGALGIAQFMPATASQLGINPLDPAQAINGAARYLASLYAQTGTWSEALAAYNWGIGNVKRKGLANAPTETRNYYAQILGDINTSNGTAYA